MASKASTSIATWDFQSFHVQHELSGGDFINAASTLIAAGPPNVRFAGDASAFRDNVQVQELNAYAYPIGVLESFGMGQNKQLQRLFEIGSKRSYFNPGRNIGRLNLARTLYHGPSLLRVLYAYYPASKIHPTVASLLASASGARGAESTPIVDNLPGFADFFINLDSDLFDQPFGLFVLLLDSDGSPYGAVYLEQCYIENHQWSINSSSVLIAEGVTVQFDQIIPVDMGVKARSLRQQESIESTLAELLG